MKLKFTKMQGAGNDYIYIDTSKYPVAEPEMLSVLLSRPHTGIGSDGLVLIGPSDKADFSMRIFNADGSEALMCGNASRCVGKYVYENTMTRKTEVTLETLSGIKVLELHTEDGHNVDSVTVDMGKVLDIRTVRLDGSEDCPRKEGIAVSVGNPHLVIWTDDADSVRLEEEGPVLEHHPLFPDRVNVEFAQVTGPGKIRMRVWERGSGITMACGTGACATAAAAMFSGRSGQESDIVMDGGTLHIRIESSTGHLFMTGPAEKVFDGEIELPDTLSGKVTI